MTIKEKIKQIARKAKVPAVAGLITLALGCTSEFKKDRLVNLEEINNEFLADKINNIAVYTLFNGRAMSYQDFVGATGIFSPISPQYSNASLWIEVVPSGSDLKYDITTTEGSSRVRIDLPEPMAREVLEKLNNNKNKSSRVAPLTNKDFENLPVGGY